MIESLKGVNRVFLRSSGREAAQAETAQGGAVEDGEAGISRFIL